MPNNHPQRLLLRNPRLVLPERLADRGDVLIQQGRIKAISCDGSLSSADSDEQYDLTGLTLFPGFIDVHIHGAMGVDTMAADAADLNRVSTFLATRGVTGWMPTLVPAPISDYVAATRAIKTASTGAGASILGVHYEGPFVNGDQCGALRKQFFRDYSSAADIDDLPTLSQNARHMMTVAPEIVGGIELVRELKQRNWIVAVGHTRADFDVLELAFDAGARHMTHFMNAMAPLHHRSPGAVGWGLSRDDVTCDVIADGIHLDKRMLQLLVKIKRSTSLMLISDAIAAAGLGDGAYAIWGETISVQEGRTSNAAGSIAGSVITMLDAVRLMLTLGASEVDVAQMSATNPARLLGLERECGSIEEGKRADLVALDAELNPRLTLVGGQKRSDE